MQPLAVHVDDDPSVALRTSGQPCKRASLTSGGASFGSENSLLVADVAHAAVLVDYGDVSRRRRGRFAFRRKVRKEAGIRLDGST